MEYKTKYRKNMLPFGQLVKQRLRMLIFMVKLSPIPMLIQLHLSI